MKFSSKEKIIMLLYRKGWTQDMLARRAHMSTSSLSRILRDKRRKIRDDELRSLAQALAIPVEELSND